eukprot:tig00000383_g24613.t1
MILPTAITGYFSGAQPSGDGASSSSAPAKPAQPAPAPSPRHKRGRPSAAAKQAKEKEKLVAKEVPKPSAAPDQEAPKPGDAHVSTMAAAPAPATGQAQLKTNGRAATHDQPAQYRAFDTAANHAQPGPAVPAPLPRIPRKDAHGNFVVATNLSASRHTVVLSDSIDELRKHRHEDYAVLIQGDSHEELKKVPELVDEATGRLNPDAHRRLYEGAVAMLSPALRPVVRACPATTRFLGRSPRVAHVHFDDVTIPIQILAELTERPELRRDIDPCDVMFINFPSGARLRVTIKPDLSIAERKAVYAGLTPQEKKDGASYRIITNVSDTYNNLGLLRMAKALVSAPDWHDLRPLFFGPDRKADCHRPPQRTPLTPTLLAIQALHLDPTVENGNVRHIIIPPRPGAVPFLPNIAIIGREMVVGPDAIYADEIALRAAAGSDELAHIHRVYYPDGIGGRVSRRAGTTAHARHLNAVSAVLRGVPIEEALKEVAAAAARSRKRKAEEAAADGAAPAPAPPPPPPRPRRGERLGERRRGGPAPRAPPARPLGHRPPPLAPGDRGVH